MPNAKLVKLPLGPLFAVRAFSFIITVASLLSRSPAARVLARTKRFPLLSFTLITSLCSTSIETRPFLAFAAASFSRFLWVGSEIFGPFDAVVFYSSHHSLHMEACLSYRLSLSLSIGSTRAGESERCVPRIVEMRAS